VGSGTFTESSEVRVKRNVTIEGAGTGSTTIKVSSGSKVLNYRPSPQNDDVEDGAQELRDLTLEGNNRSQTNGAYCSYRDNVKFRRVAFNNFSGPGLDIRSREFNQAGDTAPPANFTNATRATVNGIEVDGCSFNNCGSNEGTSSGGSFIIGGTNGAKIYGMTMNHTRTDCYGIKYGTGVGGWNYGLQIYNCNINVAGQFSIELFNAYNGCEIYDVTTNKPISMGGNKLGSDGVKDVRIHHNTINNTDTLFGIEVQMGDIEIDYNIIKNPGTSGIAIWNAGDNSTGRTTTSITM
jgi:hypothetical protein